VSHGERQSDEAGKNHRHASINRPADAMRFNLKKKKD
jgi:hypothetical protein